MLESLVVQDFALINRLQLHFTPGLNILTGETGAGKSILIGAISLILGERATVDQIRSGSDHALIEAFFRVENPGIRFILQEAQIPEGEGNELILSRELSREGRNICRVNGRSVPLSLLKEMGRFLVDLHGQHQHQSLLDSEAHLELLDGFGGEPLQQNLEQYRGIYARREEVRKNLQQIGSTGPERERQLEFLRFQIQEIQQFNPDPEDERELEERQRVLNNVEKLLSTAAGAHEEIFAGGDLPSLLDRLQHQLTVLTSMSTLDNNLSPLVELLESASAQLEEAGHGLRKYTDAMVFDPDELEQIQERLQGYRQLQRKYGKDTASVLDYCRHLQQQLSALEHSRVQAEELHDQLVALDEQLQEAASVLSDRRSEAAHALEHAVGLALTQLDLAGARFGVEISPASPGPRGADRVEFLFSANRGEPLKPLSKVISGGEMSRVMLAMKSILAEQDQIPTLIFDEIDTGISGTTVDAVAEKMAGLGRKHQVIAVTHHPQIAARAACHWQIYKEEDSGRTYTRVRNLQAEERQREIARLLDGTMSDLALEHAREMLNRHPA